MSEVQDTYPGIARAALEISYDVGGIDRFRSEESMLAALAAFVAKHQEGLPANLRTSLIAEWLAIDMWLAAQTDEALATICGGEEGEMMALLAGSPPGTNELLNMIFEDVA
jgi:hypothetical protein